MIKFSYLNLLFLKIISLLRTDNTLIGIFSQKVKIKKKLKEYSLENFETQYSLYVSKKNIAKKFIL